MNKKITCIFNPLPYYKIWTLTESKAFADDKFNGAKILKSLFDRVENILRKGVNAGNQHFLLFQQCFQKVSFSVLLTLSQTTNFRLFQN